MASHTTFRGRRAARSSSMRNHPVTCSCSKRSRREYCYKIRASSLRDGERVLVAEECVASSLAPLTRRPSTGVERAEALIGCRTAPRGYDEEWSAAKTTLQDAGLFPLDGPSEEDVAPDDDVVLDDDEEAADARSGAGGGCELNRGRRSGVGAFLASLLLLGLAARKRTS